MVVVVGVVVIVVVVAAVVVWACRRRLRRPGANDTQYASSPLARLYEPIGKINYSIAKIVLAHLI